MLVAVKVNLLELPSGNWTDSMQVETPNVPGLTVFPFPPTS